MSKRKDIEIVPFDNRPNFLRSSHGYIYGTCSRLYYFAFNTGTIGHTSKVKELMKLGKEMHEKLQDYLTKKFPNGYSEKFRFKVYRNVSNIVCTTHLDFLIQNGNNFYALEIKPYYTYSAYIQILMQKLIKPEYNFLCFTYKRSQRIFPVKADYDMAKVYFSRVLTARTYLTPIPPRLNVSHKICLNCLFHDRCYDTEYITVPPKEYEGISWGTFKALSKVKLKRLELV